MGIENVSQLNLTKNSLKDLDEFCRKKGKEFRRIKTHQIRSFFSGITRIKTMRKNKNITKEELQNQMVMLRPKLAYAKGRHKEIGPMYEFFDKAICSVIDAKDEDFEKALDNFFFIAESIVAYHCFYGGEKSINKEENHE